MQIASGAVAGTYARNACAQPIFQAGIIPVGKTTVANGRAEVLQYCDEIAQLGFHRYELNNTRAGIAEYYVARISEFKEQMAA